MSQAAGNGQVVIDFRLIEAPRLVAVPVAALPVDHQPLLCAIEPPVGSMAHLVDWLTPDEQLRGARLQPAQRQRLWMATHSALNRQLSVFAGSESLRPSVMTLPGGKPVMCPPALVHFNLADTDRFAVLGFHLAPIGIDVERIPAQYDYRLVVDRYFSSRDQQWLESSKSENFFLLWTRKEAILKLTGAGLTDRIPDFDVSPDCWVGDGSVVFVDQQPHPEIAVYSFFINDLVFSVAFYHRIDQWERNHSANHSH